MKIGVCAYGYGSDNIDGWGGLEQRFAVNWAEFLRMEGHEVHNLDPFTQGADESYDLYIDGPVETCEKIKSKVHIHGNFSPPATLNSQEILNLDCYKGGRYIYSSPYRKEYLQSLGMATAHGKKHTPVFMPIPYPDALLPKDMLPAFDRRGIAWINKGNFDPVFGPDKAMFLVTNGINTLKALVRLRKKAEFKVVFALNYLITSTREEWRGEVEALIGQLDSIRLDRLPWRQLVAIQGQCKMNTQIGNLTSSINESVFTYGLPMTHTSMGHLGTIDILPPATEVTEDEIYDIYERLWFDKRLYYQMRDAFQDTFRDHRTEGVRKAWKDLCEQLNLG